MSKTYRHKKTTGGFTLVEIMVSVAIFAIVTIITSGSFIVLANIYRKIQGNRAIIDNLNLAMDVMTLQVREGKGYDFPGCSGDICPEITFKEYEIYDGNYTHTADIGYSVDADNRLEQCVTEIYPVYKSPKCIPLTSKEIQINNLSFIKKNTDPLLVQVIMDGKAKNKVGLETEFLLQTTLTQRNY